MDKCIIYKVDENRDNKEEITNDKEITNGKKVDETYTDGIEDILEEQEKLLPNSELEVTIENIDEKKKEEKVEEEAEKEEEQEEQEDNSHKKLKRDKHQPFESLTGD